MYMYSSPSEGEGEGRNITKWFKENNTWEEGAE